MRFVIRFFCHSIYVNKPELLQSKGPLLIASNHPNSFLDAIIYDILFDVPIWSLARGDVFKRFPKAIPWLHRVKIFPIYRTREGAENLVDNYKTFEACMAVFSRQEAVTIFSEALCVNEWHLRPLKKGTARIAFKAWEQGIPLLVIPAGINYTSFRRYGKAIHIHFGTPLRSEQFDLAGTDGNKYGTFNNELQNQLSHLVYEIEPGDHETFHQKFGIKSHPFKETLLLVPALLATLFHFPLYFLGKYIAGKLVSDRDHYDSILFAFLLLAYPLYLIIFTLVLFVAMGSGWSFSALLLLPFTVWGYVNRKVRKDVAFLNRSQ